MFICLLTVPAKHRMSTNNGTTIKAEESISASIEKLWASQLLIDDVVKSICAKMEDLCPECYAKVNDLQNCKKPEGISDVALGGSKEEIMQTQKKELTV